MKWLDIFRLTVEFYFFCPFSLFVGSVSVGPYLWVSCDSEQVPSRNASEQIAKQLSNHIKSGVLCSLYYFHDIHTHNGVNSTTDCTEIRQQMLNDWNITKANGEKKMSTMYYILLFSSFVSVSLSSLGLLLCVYRFSLDFVHSSDLSRTSNRIVWP